MHIHLIEAAIHSAIVPNLKGASECSKNGGSVDDIAVVCN